MLKSKEARPVYELEPVLHVGSISDRMDESLLFPTRDERWIALEELKRIYLLLPKRNSSQHSMPDNPVPSSSHLTMSQVLEAFARLGVEFVVIGGYAVVFHGHVRLTKDVDLFIHASCENAKRIIDAFHVLGFSHPELTEEGLMKTGSVYRFGRAPSQVELLNEVKGISWDEAVAGAIPEKLLDQPVLFIDLETLLKCKKAAGRLQDLADVEALERIHRDSWLR